VCCVCDIAADISIVGIDGAVVIVADMIDGNVSTMRVVNEVVGMRVVVLVVIVNLCC